MFSRRSTSRLRTRPLLALTGGLLTLLTATTATPAVAQAEPVPGRGNAYYLAGAWNDDGQAQALLYFGNANDVVYFGDWYGIGVDLPLVRRGNSFHVPSEDDPSVTARVFSYGDVGDTVLAGDWDGDGVDSLAVRRGNHYFVKNDTRTTGRSDTDFFYGDPGDVVLVGNWDNRLVPPTATTTGKGDTLIVRRGNRYFVKNDLLTGTAEYYRDYGSASDTVLVANWVAGGLRAHRTFFATPTSADDADQLVVRRGNEYIASEELRIKPWELYLQSAWVTAYGEPGDAVFVASFPTPVDANGKVIDDFDTAADVIEADGLGIRRLS